MDRRNSVRLELSLTPIILRPREGWLVNSSGLAEHLFYFCRQGSFRALVRKKTLEIKAGEALWISRNTPFHLESDFPTKTVLARFRLQMETKSGEIFALKTDYVRGLLGDFSLLWLEMLQFQEFQSGTLDTPSLRASLAGLLTEAFTAGVRFDHSRMKLGGLSAVQVQTLLDWVRALPPSARPTTEDLAQQIKLSPDYANQLCRRSFRVSVEKWIIDQRIRAAAQRLAESALTISQVAEEFGYSSLYFFSRQFRSVMACSPREYRLNHKSWQTLPQLNK